MITPDSIFYNWFGMNTALFLLINEQRWPAVDAFMQVVTLLGHPNLYPFYMASALAWTWRNPGSLPLRNVVAFAVGYPLVSVVVVPALKAGLDFPRPVAALGANSVRVLGHPDALHSFPSGHAAFAVLMAMSLAPGTSGGFRIGLALFAVLVCISRISVGAHFPADVAAGALLALLIAFAVRLAITACARP